MFAYVTRNSVEVGDHVSLELWKGGNVLTVVQVSKVTRVEPSPHHPESDPMDEIEF